jgi:hypothetical protein
MNRSELLKLLHSLRLKLHETAESRGSLTDPDVLAISEEADRLIVILQQIQRDKLCATANRITAAESFAPQFPEKLS